MEQLCLPFNHEPCINRMAVIMANEDIANGYWDNWDAAYESNWDILENEIAAQEDERRYLNGATPPINQADEEG